MREYLSLATDERELVDKLIHQLSRARHPHRVPVYSQGEQNQIAAELSRQIEAQRGSLKANADSADK